MKALILAAGEGKRLKPLTNYVSKAMLPIGNIPVTELIIRDIKAETSITEFIILARSPEQDIVRHLKNLTVINRVEESNPLSEINIDFTYQPEQCGMGHALQGILESNNIEENFLLAACDSIYPKGEVGSFVKSFSPDMYDGLLAVIMMPDDKIRSSSSVRLEGDVVTDIIEKPSPGEILSRYASLPLYILKADILGYLHRIEKSPRGEYELQDALRMMMADGCIFGRSNIRQRETITTITDFISLNKKYLSAGFQISRNEIDDVMIIEPVLIPECCEIGAGCVIGPNTVIGPNSRIGENCKIKDSVILRDSILPDGSTVINACWQGTMLYPSM